MNINWDKLRDNHLGVAILIIILAILVARLLHGLLRRMEKSRLAGGDNDPTQFRFLRNSVSAVVFIVAAGMIMYVIPGGKTLAVSIFAGAGIFAAIVGFASQQAFSNIVSGVFIVIFKPFRVGDIIEIGTAHRGVVEDITLRHTVIRNWENKRVIIPNSAISADTVTNSSIHDPKTCRFVEMGISYESDITTAMRIMREEAEAHPLCIDARTEEQIAEGTPKVVVRLIGFGDSSVNLRAYAWAKTAPEAFELGTELNQKIKERFDREGVEIPYPHRTLVIKNGGKDAPF